MKIVLASHNEGKIVEFKSWMHDLSIELIPQSDFQISDIEETGLTFVENALLKARHAAEASGLPVIADDSGLSVPVLAYQPGIYSARYAGPKASNQQNIEKLLNALNAVPADKRHAYFYCVVVYLRHARDPVPVICQGRWSGMITLEPQGQQGFGYDPIFYVPSEKATAAELSLTRKNEISHRGQALKALTQQLSEIIS